MTWVLLNLMFSFGAQSARIAAVLPPPNSQMTLSVIDQGASTLPSNARFADMDFNLTVGGTPYRWDTLAFFMLPGEQRSFKVTSADRDGGFTWSATGGAFVGNSEREKTFVAPSATGLYRLKVARGAHARHISVFVMVPFLHQESVNGYRIGAYSRQTHFAHLDLPRGFIEVTPLEINTWLSPHFQLKDFVCHEPSNFPKYVVLRENLLRKLEFLIALVQQHGYRCPGFKVLSGYRTPFFNSEEGNTENSVHTYGGAADIYVDADNDGIMDDLNHDGRHNESDAVVLYNLADLLEKQYPEFQGGDGYYPATGPHGAFVHTDIRGQHARWHQ